MAPTSGEPPIDAGQEGRSYAQPGHWHQGRHREDQDVGPAGAVRQYASSRALSGCTRDGLTDAGDQWLEEATLFSGDGASRCSVLTFTTARGTQYTFEGGLWIPRSATRFKDSGGG